MNDYFQAVNKDLQAYYSTHNITKGKNKMTITRYTSEGKKNVVYTNNDNRLINLLVTIVIVGIIILAVTFFMEVTKVKADSIPNTELAYQVMTSLCYDPLLGSVTIGSVCNEGETPRKVNEDDISPASVTVDIIPTLEDDTVIIPDNEIIPEVVIDIPPSEVVTVEDDKPLKNKCNHGEGNGGEGCNNNLNGNNDEDDKHPSEKDKKNNK